MRTTASPQRSSSPIRPLAPRDLAAVVAIDARLSSRLRRVYFQRRLAAAERDPERHLQLAVEHGGELAGFMIGRSLEGEFGRSEPALRLEAFGVREDVQNHGLGAALAAAFEAAAAARGLAEIRTTALWRDHGLLRFLDRASYRLAGSHVLDCALGDAALGSAREQPVDREPPPRDPNDFSARSSPDFEELARDVADVGLLREEDVEGMARVDRRVTGRDRRGFLCRLFADSLSDSGLRISLAARVDGAVAGFVMARLDYGDFGRAEPVAVIDTIGVDPLRARQGIGRALLSQLFVNLAALKVERVETIVAAGELGLLGFFYAAGLRPAERLSFVKRLAG